ncbi:ATP-dependent dethiobiotin synthetase BioD [Janibacter cremeus]|uniref:Dethiobiotin synthetase n=1 Tax=Janibacter cremeus TaxID=1285192 RepID=A0A852VVB0_9MICO|nr:AAA family ATPase [Janibacter cremeus]NYF98603.1 dethiobiotin synthetase [Janibacter cremeus]
MPTTLEDLSLPRAVLVSGSGTHVGTSVVTAALAAALTARGSDVGLVTPVRPDHAPADAPVVTHAKRVAGLDTGLVLVEGAGGLLVRLDKRGGTLADVGTALRYMGVSTGVVVVASTGPGAVNSLALTAEALATRSLPLLGVIVADWPHEFGPAELADLEELPLAARAPLLGVLPHGAGSLAPQEFTSRTPEWFSPVSWATMQA